MRVYLDENLIEELECDHERTFTETEEFGNYHPDYGTVYTQDIEYCKDCNASRIYGDDEWSSESCFKTLEQLIKNNSEYEVLGA